MKCPYCDKLLFIPLTMTSDLAYLPPVEYRHSMEPFKGYFLEQPTQPSRRMM